MRMTKTFAELGLNEHILAGVEELGFATPTPVQEQAIPAVLAGRDVIASAQTGTGKTAAFALPVLQVIEPLSLAARSRPKAEAPAPADATSTVAGEGGGNSPQDRPTSSSGHPGPDVLADRVEDDSSLSAPVDPDGSIKGAALNGPKRRRRRRHKKATPEDVPSREGASGHDPDVGSGARPASPEAPAAEADKPKRKRRRRKKPASKHSGSPADDSREKDPAARPFGPFALVVTPTRELAAQIEDVVSVVCRKTGQKTVVVMGGARFERQIRELESGCDLLVATPGRLIDLMEHEHVSLADVRVLVLDEADRMLDMGFWPSVRRIVKACPEERQTLLFSATIPPSIKGTVDAMLHDPASIEIARVGETADTVEEHLCPVSQGQKTLLLEALLRTGGAAGVVPERVLVFCRTKHRSDDLEKYLKRAGVGVDVMHADRPQKARERALERFREGVCQVLVATDVMSRGIDVSGIDAVVNFDVPMDPEDYVHRIGRTGRAGATGHAYTFVAPDEISPLREIEYFTHTLVGVWDLEGFDYDDTRIVPNPGRSTTKATRTMFSGSRSRGRGIGAGRYGRHF